MALPLSDTTRERLELLFSGEARERARDLLERECGDSVAGLGADRPQLVERVRCAALRMSEGDLDELASAVTLARTDFRDALVSAGFGESNAHERWMPGA